MFASHVRSLYNPYKNYNPKFQTHARLPDVQDIICRTIFVSSRVRPPGPSTSSRLPAVSVDDKDVDDFRLGWEFITRDKTRVKENIYRWVSV